MGYAYKTDGLAAKGLFGVGPLGSTTGIWSCLAPNHCHMVKNIDKPQHPGAY